MTSKKVLMVGWHPSAVNYSKYPGLTPEKLDAIIAYGQSALCRWLLILRHFGESLDSDACGHCDNCRRNAARAA